MITGVKVMASACKAKALGFKTIAKAKKFGLKTKAKTKAEV